MAIGFRIEKDRFVADLVVGSGGTYADDVCMIIAHSNSFVDLNKFASSNRRQQQHFY